MDDELSIRVDELTIAPTLAEMHGELGLNCEILIPCEETFTDSKDHQQLKYLYSRCKEAHVEALYKHNVNRALPNSYITYKLSSDCAYLFAVGSFFFLKIQWSSMKLRKSTYRKTKFLALAYTCYFFYGVALTIEDHFRDNYVRQFVLKTANEKELESYGKFVEKLEDEISILREKENYEESGTLVAKDPKDKEFNKIDLEQYEIESLKFKYKEKNQELIDPKDSNSNI